MLYTDINLAPVMSDEDKHFGVTFVLENMMTSLASQELLLFSLEKAASFCLILTLLVN